MSLGNSSKKNGNEKLTLRFEIILMFTIKPSISKNNKSCFFVVEKGHRAI